MLIPDAKGDVLLFVGPLLKIFACDVLSDKGQRMRVETPEGMDITPVARVLSVQRDYAGVDFVRSYAEAELNLPGFDGPFCTLGFDLPLQSDSTEPQ